MFHWNKSYVYPLWYDHGNYSPMPCVHTVSLSMGLRLPPVPTSLMFVFPGPVFHLLLGHLSQKHPSPSSPSPTSPFPGTGLFSWPTLSPGRTVPKNKCCFPEQEGGQETAPAGKPEDVLLHRLRITELVAKSLLLPTACPVSLLQSM